MIDSLLTSLLTRDRAWPMARGLSVSPTMTGALSESLSRSVAGSSQPHSPHSPDSPYSIDLRIAAPAERARGAVLDEQDRGPRLTAMLQANREQLAERRLSMARQRLEASQVLARFGDPRTMAQIGATAAREAAMAALDFDRATASPLKTPEAEAARLEKRTRFAGDLRQVMGTAAEWAQGARRVSRSTPMGRFALTGLDDAFRFARTALERLESEPGQPEKPLSA